MIRDSGIVRAHPGVDLKHLPRAPDCKQPLVQLSSRPEEVNFGNTSTTEGSSYSVFSSLQQPTIGSLLLVADGQNHGVFRKATSGGVIHINNSKYVMTAGHAFVSQPEASTTNLNNLDDLAFSDSDESWDDSSSVKSDSALSDLECELDLDLDLSVVSLSDIDDKIDEDSKSLGLHSPCSPYGHTFVGELALSSLDGSSPELDYALIRLHGQSTASPSEDYKLPLCTQPNHLGNELSAPVVAYTASGGCLNGIIAPGSSFMRTPNACKYQEVYHVALEQPLADGDCGSWVYDGETNKLYGHIVAGAPETGLACVVPAYQIFEDIEKLVPLLSQRCETRESTTGSSQADQLSHDSQTRGDYENVGSTSEIHEGIWQVLSEPEPKTGQLQNGAAAGHTLSENRTHTSFEKAAAVSFQAIMKKGRLEALREWRNRIKDGRPPPFREQQYGHFLVPVPPNGMNLASLRFERLLHSLSNTPIRWEDPQLLDEALQHLPLELLYEEAEKEADSFEAVASDLTLKPCWSYQDCVIRALMRWFKRSFFSWVSNPPCEVCHGPTTAIGLAAPTTEEVSQGAQQVEVYSCRNEVSHDTVRFPRYQDSATLLQTRRGRVGEWANAFGLLCRALGSRVRWVWNGEDHVWIEVYSAHRKRWVHVDVCEEAWDKPLMYTDGWQRRLSYCIAFSTEGAVDVTSRYVRQNRLAALRTRCSEAELLYVLEDITTLRRQNMSKEHTAKLEKECKREAKAVLYDLITSLVQDMCKDFATYWSDDANAGSSDGARSDLESKALDERADMSSEL
ncbi:hypothetical protein C7974DRAFT_408862 [Boeremia exigua]|uniref:uncharacterized protein n=1 Tax=Boeremia exigua TaxID=749465 RepID=UPI001E8CF1E6|nr:uncharacterized protein C7974DRAFT_408862 [Boeremia exigua]KAH6642296.1 hypothetical protein C7974DRAFT_408862 [Boeremia exigua]